MLHTPKPIIIKRPATLPKEKMFWHMFAHLTLTQLINVIIAKF